MPSFLYFISSRKISFILIILLDTSASTVCGLQAICVLFVAHSAKLAAVGCLTVCWCADARQPTSVANATCRNLDSDGRLTVRPSAMRGMQAWHNVSHMTAFVLKSAKPGRRLTLQRTQTQRKIAAYFNLFKWRLLADSLEYTLDMPF